MKVRQSNIEFLRIILMLMMLYLHFIKGIRWGGEEDLLEQQSLEVQHTYFFFWILSIGMTDAFVLISGWFGIRYSTKGLVNFIFQAIFLNALVFGIRYLTDDIEISVQTFKDIFFLSGVGWFFKAYLVLFLMAPVLNAFLEKVSRKELEHFLLLYFAFLFVGGWIFEYSTPFIHGGFSPFSFFGLYLFARYLRLYVWDKNTSLPVSGKWLKFSKLKLFLCYLIPLVLTFVIGFPNFAKSGLGMRLTSYVSPIVICSATALLLFFLKVQVPRSKWINTIARSAFAVYIVQESPFFVDIYNTYAIEIFLQFDGLLAGLSTLGYIAGVFLLCILVDQLRILIWKRIERKFFPA